MTPDDGFPVPILKGHGALLHKKFWDYAIELEPCLAREIDNISGAADFCITVHPETGLNLIVKPHIDYQVLQLLNFSTTSGSIT